MFAELFWDFWSTSASVSFKCSLLSNGVFWVASLLGLYADHLVATKKSSFLSRHKLQPSKIISGRDKRDLILLAAFNMIFVSLFVCCPLYEWVWNKMQAENRLEEADDWMSIWHYELFLKVPIHMIMTDMAFYGVHYLLHSSPMLYKYIHKVHHRFPAPTAMACVYAHPLEFALGNVFPIYLGPMITNAHPITCYIYWCMAMIGTCKGHSGYRILGHADYHEEHHFFYKYNYGGMYVSDWLLGTMR